MIRLILTSVVGVMLFLWLLLGPLCWILRDGLGPNARETEGWEAVQRFLLTFYWGPIALVLIICTGIGIWIACSRDKTVEPDDSQ